MPDEHISSLKTDNLAGEMHADMAIHSGQPAHDSKTDIRKAVLHGYIAFRNSPLPIKLVMRFVRTWGGQARSFC